MRKLRSPGGSPLRLRREGSRRRRRPDSCRVHLLSEPRLEDLRPSCKEDEIKHQSEYIKGTVLGG